MFSNPLNDCEDNPVKEKSPPLKTEVFKKLKGISDIPAAASDP
jgi:hypothetical protein